MCKFAEGAWASGAILHAERCTGGDNRWRKPTVPSHSGNRTVGTVGQLWDRWPEVETVDHYPFFTPS